MFYKFMNGLCPILPFFLNSHVCLHCTLFNEKGNGINEM